MASKEHDALMAVIPGQNVDANDPVDVVREKMHAIHPSAAPPGTIVEPDTLDGLDAKWIYTEENADSDRIVIHVHGGAFVSTVVDTICPTESSSRARSAPRSSASSGPGPTKRPTRPR